jgi:hypothetical protein
MGYSTRLAQLGVGVQVFGPNLELGAVLLLLGCSTIEVNLPMFKWICKDCTNKNIDISVLNFHSELSLCFKECSFCQDLTKCCSKQWCFLPILFTLFFIEKKISAVSANKMFLKDGHIISCMNV